MLKDETEPRSFVQFRPGVAMLVVRDDLSFLNGSTIELLSLIHAVNNARLTFRQNRFNSSQVRYERKIFNKDGIFSSASRRIVLPLR